jgi:hypothetical protein
VRHTQPLRPARGERVRPVVEVAVVVVGRCHGEKPTACGASRAGGGRLAGSAASQRPSRRAGVTDGDKPAARIAPIIRSWRCVARFRWRRTEPPVLLPSGRARAGGSRGCDGLVFRLATMSYIIPMRWKAPEATSLPDPVRMRMAVPAEHPVTPFAAGEVTRATARGMRGADAGAVYVDDEGAPRAGGTLYAFGDLCTHKACPLSAGSHVRQAFHGRDDIGPGRLGSRLHLRLRLRWHRAGQGQAN